jgi:hypothetical protein
MESITDLSLPYGEYNMRLRYLTATALVALAMTLPAKADTFTVDTFALVAGKRVRIGNPGVTDQDCERW